MLNRRIWCSGLILALAGGIAQLLPAQNEPVLRAGAAIANITPPLGLPIVGNFTEPPATHVHDELHARCLVLDDGKTRVAFVVCDNVGIVREVYDEAKRLIQQETNLPPQNVLTSATHTHSGPSARYAAVTVEAGPLSDYQRFLARRGQSPQHATLQEVLVRSAPGFGHSSSGAFGLLVLK